MNTRIKVIETVRKLLNDPEFQFNHKRSSEYFTRSRKLVSVVMLIIQKSLKSVQLVLNEFFSKVGNIFTVVTASAFVQARSKLLYTAFIELNQAVVAEYFSNASARRTYRGFRVLAVDGSKIILPDEAEIRTFFGCIRIANQLAATGGEYPSGLASVLYDVLNGIALDSILGHAKAYEVDLAVGHLETCIKGNDLLIFDRNYSSYYFPAFLISVGISFTGRCSRASFKEVRRMFDNTGEKSRIVTLRPHHSKKKQIAEAGLPMEIRVRFVRIVLETGEIEILVTSLTDEKEYPSDDFKEIYRMRWGVETFYGIIKGRLNPENFTGKSADSVLQDFYATVFINGLESVITQSAQDVPDEKKSGNRHPQKINNAVAFNSIKNNITDLFLKEQCPEIILQKLDQLFVTNPVCVRKNRKIPRSQNKTKKILNWHKRAKKIVF